MLVEIVAAVSGVFALILCGITGAFGGVTWLWMLPVGFLGCFLTLALGGFLFLLYLCHRVDQSLPQEGDDPLYRYITRLYIKSLLPYLRVHVKKIGLEKTPVGRRFMLVCNHENNADPIILLDCFRDSQLAFISKKENATMFIIGDMMHKIQCQLLDRENDRQALKVILKCIQMLKDDQASIGVFPEGGIHDDGLLHHFRPGVFKIAQKAKVPIVVCTLKNSQHVASNVVHYRRSDVTMELVEVLEPESFAGITTVELAERVHRIMADNLGPDLVAQD